MVGGVYSQEMMAVTHTITGAAVGVAVPSAPVALTLGVLLHLLLDSLTHWNFYPFYHRQILLLSFFDVAAGVLLTYLFLGERTFTLPVLAGMLGGNLPDVWSFVGQALKIRLPVFDRLHNHLQWETLSLPRGFVSQGLAIAAALGIFLTQ